MCLSVCLVGAGMECRSNRVLEEGLNLVANWLPLQQAAPPAAHRGNSSLNLGGSSSWKDPEAAQSILWWLVFLWGLQASCWILAPGGEGSRGSCGPAVGRVWVLTS